MSDSLIAFLFVSHVMGILVGTLMSRPPLTVKRCLWLLFTGSYYWWYSVGLGAKELWNEWRYLRR